MFKHPLQVVHCSLVGVFNFLSDDVANFLFQMLFLKVSQSSLIREDMPTLFVKAEETFLTHRRRKIWFGFN